MVPAVVQHFHLLLEIGDGHDIVLYAGAFGTLEVLDVVVAEYGYLVAGKDRLGVGYCQCCIFFGYLGGSTGNRGLVIGRFYFIGTAGHAGRNENTEKEEVLIHRYCVECKFGALVAVKKILYGKKRKFSAGNIFKDVFFYSGPFTFQDAVINSIAPEAIGHQYMTPQYAFEPAADLFNRQPRLLVSFICL